MDHHRYTWLASTYRPSGLGITEFGILDLFAQSESLSAYGIFKPNEDLESIALYYRHSSYKDVHKRVKRLVQLKLIDRIDESFERGAKHYKITPYGLITYLDQLSTSVSRRYIVSNKKNIVIQSLLMEFLEEQTIDSLDRLEQFPTTEISQYLQDCCSITAKICKYFWTELERCNITDILPPDDVIQKYMSYLDGKSIDQYTLDEIEKYKKRLKNKLDDSEIDNKELRERIDFSNTKYILSSPDVPSFHPSIRNYLEERPPFPLLDIYYDVVWLLDIRIEYMKVLLVFNIISQLAEKIINLKVESKDQLEKLLLEGSKGRPLRHLLKDKQFIELVKLVKKDFDIGYKQFLHYH